MAIGTAAAIGLGVAGIGSALSASSSSKAAGKAADTSLAVASQNNALARDIYGQNKEILSPFVQRGNRAGEVMNAFLGLGGPEPVAANNNSYVGGNNAFSGYRGTTYNGFPSGGYDNRETFADSGYSLFNSFGPANGQQTTRQTPSNGARSLSGNAQEAADNAFDIFKNSSNYQWRLGQGQDALNSGYAGRGILRSGAAAKGFADYNQNQASNEANNWLGWLSGQQGAGLGAASAQAGVSQNYVGQVSQNNNNAGTAAANAALVKGQNNPFAGLLGTIGGGVFGSSFG